jgi:hypothetical protein
VNAYRDGPERMAGELLVHETLDSVAVARLLDNVPKWRREGNGRIHPANRILEPGAVA